MPPSPARPAAEKLDKSEIAPNFQAIFDRSRVGVIQAGLDRRIRYANQEALRILGADDYRGRTLDEAIADDESRKRFAAQLEERYTGLMGNYQINVRRLSDSRQIPLDITGVPLADRQGKVYATLGLLRSMETEHAVNAIERLNSDTTNGHGLIKGVAEQLCALFPADLVIATRYSLSHSHANPFFIYRHRAAAKPVEWRKRWIPLNEKQRDVVLLRETKLTPDMNELLNTSEVWRNMRDDPFVKLLVGEGCVSFLSRPAIRRKRVIGRLSLVSRKRDGFTPDDQELFSKIPIDVSVAHAIEWRDQEQESKRFKLLQELSRCTEVAAACDVLARSLHEIYDWSHVSIFRVDHVNKRIRLVAQESVPEAELPKDWSQGFDQGILGRVVRQRAAQVVPDVRKDRDYLHASPSPTMISEMCWPIIGGYNKSVRWIINVEDAEENAFSEDESAWLKGIAHEVSGMIENIGTLQFQAGWIKNTSEAMLVVDVDRAIKKANPSAARLLGYHDAKEVQGELSELFVSQAEYQRFLESSGPEAGEFLLKRGDDPTAAVSAHISQRPLPEDLLGGTILVMRDTGPIRRAVELETLGQAAYEVAVQTHTPLALAISELERFRQKGQQAGDDVLERVLRHLGRVKHGYTKLAFFHRDARPSEAERCPLNLLAELRGVRAGFSETERSLIKLLDESLASDPSQASISADAFQVALILETILVTLVRGAPEDDPVRVDLSASADEVTLEFSGYVPPPFASTSAGKRSSVRAELRLAQPLIQDIMEQHRGRFESRSADDARVVLRLTFPRLL